MESNMSINGNAASIYASPSFSPPRPVISTLALMLKLTLNIIQILIGVYWAGEVARQNPKIDNFVAQLESGYGKFNQSIKDANIIEGLSALRKLYGWLAITAFVLLFVLGRFFATSPRLGYFWSVTFAICCFGWFSIKWCLEHKKTVAEFGPQVALIVFGPLWVGVFDLLMGTPFMQILSEPFQKIPNPWGFQFPTFTNPIAFGAVLSGILTFFFAVYYAITWFLTVPTSFVSALFIVVPVFLARFVHVIAPRKPFFGFTVLLFAGATLWQLRL
jgi:hypothetical protein